jgi:hypothetical protein
VTPSEALTSTMEQPMTKAAKKTITTMPQLIRAYGGEVKMAKAFQTTPECIRRWKRWGGVPCTEYLGLYMGLEQRGYVPGPKLFNVKRLDELPGM